MINFILQPGNMLTAEKFCVTTGQYKSQYVPFDKLGETKYDGFPVPLGSVEYTHEFCKHRNIPIPPNISYPDELQKYLHRSVWKDVYENVDDDLFVKPQATKIFTGDIKENIDVDVDPQCPVWVSDPLSITTEIRYYILNKKCMGFVQYDQFDENVDGKDYLNFVDNILASYTSAPVTYTIDIGFTNENFKNIATKLLKNK
jgi:hypothetical protein